MDVPVINYGHMTVCVAGPRRSCKTRQDQKEKKRKNKLEEEDEECRLLLPPPPQILLRASCSVFFPGVVSSACSTPNVLAVGTKRDWWCCHLSSQAAMLLHQETEGDASIFLILGLYSSSASSKSHWLAWGGVSIYRCKNPCHRRP